MHFSFLMDNYWKYSDVAIDYGIFGPIEIITISAKLLIFSVLNGELMHC